MTVWPPDLAPDHRFVPLAQLDVAELARRLGTRLGDPPLRVGQSAAVMGLASRLWALTVVPVLQAGVLPDPATFWVRDEDGALVLGATPGRGWTDVSTADVHQAVVGVLEPVIDALPLSRRLLWGNVAASLHAVPRVHGVDPGALIPELLDRAPLAGELDQPGSPTARRRTCCLFYLIPGAAVCGDCVFLEAPGRSRDRVRRLTRGS